MRKNIIVIATIASAALLTVSAQADLLYFNDIDGTGNAFSSQNDTSGGNGNYATVYAGFSVAPGSQLTGFSWVGEFFNPAQHADITGFQIDIYADNAGTVGTHVATGFFGGNGGETFLGNFGGFDSYVYEEDFAPFAFSGNGWVSVVADLGFPPQWGMAAGVGGPLGYQDFFGTRSQLSNSIAIAVLGNGPAVPEPASMAALGLGVAALIRRRRASK